MKRMIQYNRTDRDITDAFLKLLQEKPFEKITIQDIITEAMVNRSTFYQHFSDKYDILEKLQNKYVTELTEIIQQIFAHNRISLQEIDKIMDAYFIKNRQVLRIILKIKTEHVDIAEQIRDIFTAYFRKSVLPISDLDAYLISGLWMDFFIYYTEHDEIDGSYSTTLFESFYKMCLIFFHLEKNKAGQKAFDELINTYAGKDGE